MKKTGFLKNPGVSVVKLKVSHILKVYDTFMHYYFLQK